MTSLDTDSNNTTWTYRFPADQEEVIVSAVLLMRCSLLALVVARTYHVRSSLRMLTLAAARQATLRSSTVSSRALPRTGRGSVERGLRQAQAVARRGLRHWHVVGHTGYASSSSGRLAEVAEKFPHVDCVGIGECKHNRQG